VIFLFLNTLINTHILFCERRYGTAVGLRRD